jgi:hypothetical protein
LGEKSKIPKLEEETEPTTYKTQEAIAEELYKRIKTKLKKFDGIDLEKQFEDFEFLVLLPNQCSLEEQTIERIKKKFIKKKNPGKNVIRICPNSADSQNQWDCFLQRTRENPKTFYLVIHDECQTGMSSAIKFLGLDQGDYHYLNGRLLPNLFTIMVSATPYNFFTNPYLKQADILYWNQHLGKKTAPKHLSKPHSLQKRNRKLQNVINCFRDEQLVGKKSRIFFPNDSKWIHQRIHSCLA